MLLVSVVFLEQKKKVKISPSAIIAVSLIIRALFVFSEPFLSDDIFRYEFDGKMLLSGHNPYSASPLESSVIYPGMAGHLTMVNHPELVTIYPPAAQLVFSLGAALGSVKGIKFFLVILDLLTIFMISRLLKKMGISRIKTIVYAWNPLAVIETASSGHIDSAAVFFLILSLYMAFSFYKNDRFHPPVYLKPPANVLGLCSGLVFSLSFLTKLFPVVFFPLFLAIFFKYSGIRGVISFFSGFSAGVLLLCTAFLPDMAKSFGTLSTYARNWEFSGFVFRTFRDMAGNGDTARLMVSSIYAFICLLIYSHAFKSLKDREFRKKELFLSFYYLSFFYLILTPTLHPWYALYLAAFLPFVSGVSGICLVWAVLLSYRVMIPYRMTGQWIESDLVALLIFAAPVSAALIRHFSDLFFRVEVVNIGD